MNRSPIPLALLLLAPLGCTGTDVGNPVVDVDFALTGTSGAGAAITDSWLTVDRVRLRSAADCSGGAEVELAGPFTVDLFAPGAIETLRGIAVPAIDYCRFEIRWSALEGAPPAGAPPELAGASFILLGERGDGVPFSIRSRRSDDLRLDAVDGAFRIDEATHALFVALDASALLDGVDLDGASVDEDGVIRIEEDANGAQLAVFEENLDAAARLFDDDDGNGQLDEVEAGDDDVLAD